MGGNMFARVCQDGHDVLSPVHTDCRSIPEANTMNSNTSAAIQWHTCRGNRAHMSDSTVAPPRDRSCGMASTRPSELSRQVRGASPLLDVNRASPLGTGVLGVSPNTRSPPYQVESQDSG